MKVSAKSSPMIPQEPVRLDPAARTGRRGAGTERVTLSAGISALERLALEIGPLREVDEARIADLRQAVENGTYAPPPRDVAAALLREIEAAGGVL